MTGFTAPQIAYGALSPILIVIGAVLVGVLIEALAPRSRRWVLQLAVAVIGLLAAFVAVVILAEKGFGTAGSKAQIIVGGAIAVDGPALFLEGTIALVGLVGVLLIAERTLDAGGSIVADAAALPGSAGDREAAGAGGFQTEVFPLALTAIAGMMVFPASNDLLMLFIALEVLSLPLYLMCGLARRRRLISQEAAMKYFLLGAFSSAFLVYGIALLYGYAGGITFGAIANATASAAGSSTLLWGGMVLLGVGLLFKVGAAPFQWWVPDVYQGAPTPVTALMAAATKAAAFGALLRVMYVAFGGMRWDWRPVVSAVAILTMLLGAVFSITQTDVKRLLAYSSVAHAGFLLVGIVATNAAGIGGTLFYLVTYAFTTLGSFAVVTLVRDGDGEATHLSRWAGLGKRSPLVAGVFAFFLLALAGIPLTSGFTGKFAVFQAGVSGGASGLVVIALLASAITAFPYVRVIVLMFFSEPAVDGPTVVIPGALTSFSVAIGAVVTLALGIFPSPLLHLTNAASTFIH